MTVPSEVKKALSIRAKFVGDEVILSLTKPQQDIIDKARGLCLAMARIAPLTPDLHEATQQAASSLATVLALAGDSQAAGEGEGE